MNEMSRAIASLGICGLAAVFVWKGESNTALLVLIIGMIYIW